MRPRPLATDPLGVYFGNSSCDTTRFFRRNGLQPPERPCCCDACRSRMRIVSRQLRHLWWQKDQEASRVSECASQRTFSAPFTQSGAVEWVVSLIVGLLSRGPFQNFAGIFRRMTMRHRNFRLSLKAREATWRVFRNWTRENALRKEINSNQGGNDITPTLRGCAR
jgi:hypothetical protein